MHVYTIDVILIIYSDPFGKSKKESSMESPGNKCIAFHRGHSFACFQSMLFYFEFSSANTCLNTFILIEYLLNNFLYSKTSYIQTHCISY